MDFKYIASHPEWLLAYIPLGICLLLAGLSWLTGIGWDNKCPGCKKYDRLKGEKLCGNCFVLEYTAGDGPECKLGTLDNDNCEVRECTCGYHKN